MDDLFAETLLGDYDSDAPWKAVRELRKLNTQAVFNRAAEWCQSQDPLRRARGADILAQIGKGVGKPHSFPQESFEVISAMAMRETEPLPLSSALTALGHLENAQAVEILIAKKSHPNEDVRFAAGDSDDDVRDWATFGLGEFSGLDGPEVREVLFRNFGDSSDDVRYEAMVGLAKRKDPRVLSALIETLREPDVSSAPSKRHPQCSGKRKSLSGNPSTSSLPCGTGLARDCCVTGTWDRTRAEAEISKCPTSCPELRLSPSPGRFGRREISWFALCTADQGGIP